MKNPGPKTFIIGTGGVSMYRLVKLLAGTVVHNTALISDDPIGVTLGYGIAGEDVSVESLGVGGTLEIEAAGAIALNADVYAAADGKIVALGSATANAKRIGKALQAASGSGSVIEVLPYAALEKTIMQAGTGGVAVGSLVKLSAGKIVKNTVTSTDTPIAVSLGVAAADAYAPVEFLSTGKPVTMLGAAAITLNAVVYAAASGEVSVVPTAAGTYRKIGIALESIDEAGPILVLPYDFHSTTVVSA